jgi:hypothetical protein
MMLTREKNTRRKWISCKNDWQRNKDAKRNEGTRIGCREVNTEGRIGPSHFETNEN